MTCEPCDLGRCAEAAPACVGTATMLRSEWGFQTYRLRWTLPPGCAADSGDECEVVVYLYVSDFVAFRYPDGYCR